MDRKEKNFTVCHTSARNTNCDRGSHRTVAQKPDMSLTCQPSKYGVKTFGENARASGQGSAEGPCHLGQAPTTRLVQRKYTNFIDGLPAAPPWRTEEDRALSGPTLFGIRLNW